ncbi:hypothetical protein [Poseidonocella sp. HB161398]|uniref:hypothetical protein n=1 Tax=Poseidonocella sp. HB161398 TaxID=2320855 RepID=UPI001486B0DC|nr:hypothetical protein [Poseidonocella sp. HB161398]
MAANPDRKKMREVSMRLQIKTEELNRLKEEIKVLREERMALKEKIGAEEATV